MPPNCDTTFLSFIPNVDTQYIILGGDLNCVMNTQLDRSNSKVTTLSKMATALTSDMKDYGGCDLWRFLYPDARAYSFFSHVHETYSWIDLFFFIDKALLPSVHSGIFSNSHIRPFPYITQSHIHTADLIYHYCLMMHSALQ